jgi:hypothetical protein
MRRGFHIPVGEHSIKEYKIICPNASLDSLIKKPAEQYKKKKTNFIFFVIKFIVK